MPGKVEHGMWYRRAFTAPRLPDPVEAVTRVDPAEVAPAEAGLSQRAIKSIWALVESLYRSGMHPGIAVCLRRHGKIALHRSIGYAGGLLPSEGERPLPLELDTPICLFSASKGVTGVVAHKLAEEGHINLLDPVSYYVPAYAQRGKGNISIYQLLSHRGGVPTIRQPIEVETFVDHDEMLRLVCASEPSCSEGRITEYHALTGGYVIAELVRATTGKTIRQYLDEKFRRPLGMRFFNYGLDEADLGLAATNYQTGALGIKPIDDHLEALLGLHLEGVTEGSNDDRFKRAVMPSANLYATAEEVTRFYQMMIDGGRWQGQQVLDARTVYRATRETGKVLLDRAVYLPMRYSTGFMLGGRPVGVYGANSHYAFGHLGFTNIFTWGDPQRDIAVSILTTGKPIIGPHLLLLPRLVQAIAGACSPVRDMSGGFAATGVPLADAAG